MATTSNAIAVNKSDIPNLTWDRKLGDLLTNNYIYISHLGEGYQYWRLPTEPDSITDQMPSAFSQTTALGRSAPVFTYTGSGPRDVQITLNLHRDIMDDINMANITPWFVQQITYKTGEQQNTNVGVTDENGEWKAGIPLNEPQSGSTSTETKTATVMFPGFVQDESEDYTDSLIRALQAIALPHYSDTNNVVEPPIVAVRFGDEIFIRGVVASGVTVTYEKPILNNNRYAKVTVVFTISEIDPYDAQTVFKNGSFRGVVATMKSGMGLNG
jgi:hypothetical protein